eukprot:1439485-Pyramimonas_sp.AAC.1
MFYRREALPTTRRSTGSPLKPAYLAQPEAPTVKVRWRPRPDVASAGSTANIEGPAKSSRIVQNVRCVGGLSV